MKAFREFKLNWKAKSIAFNVLDRMPFGSEAYYLLQTRITHTIPRRLTPTADTARWFSEHVRVLTEHAGAGGIGAVKTFEFGAGWDLYGNFAAWCLGVNDQVVYDLTRWLRPDQVNIVLRHLRHDPPPACLRTPPLDLPLGAAFDAALLRNYGVDYRAPADAGATGLPDGSRDAVVTTSVLEHIPPAQILRLLRECHRLLKPGGIMTHVIDYSDHFAHSDDAITPYNYLQFSEQAWQRHSPDIHYQNRLRHVDYRTLFESTGFRVLSDESEQPDNAAELLSRVALSREIARRPTSDLLPLVGHYVLQRV